MPREPHATARVYRFADGKGEIGFINPVSEPFCADCNRIRLTAEGKLRTCLFSLHETDLREPLRAGASDDELEQIDPRRRLAQGAQAPRQRAGLPPAAAHDEPDRRLRRHWPEAGARAEPPGGRDVPSERSTSGNGRWLRCYRCWSQNLEAQVHYDAILRIDPETGASPSGSTRSRRRSSSASTACTTSRT